jgi:hypothetical protein
MINPASDAGIPLLTEILVTPAIAPEPEPAEPKVPSVWSRLTIPVSPPVTVPEIIPAESEMDLSVEFDIPELQTQSHPHLASTTSTAFPILPDAEISAEKWQQLESDITERIARQVLNRIDFVLEQRVRDSLADVLQIAVEGLSQEIRRGLHQTLEDVISRAVAQEIARLQPTKN